MQPRLQHAVLACLMFFVASQLFSLFAQQPVEGLRVLIWSTAGVVSYIALSQLFGFDPQRTSLRATATPLRHYIERWELRSGQATLAMLGAVVAAAHVLDREHFVTAVVSGTLTSHLYFMLRLCAGAYFTEARH
ncbi:MAG: hypothetical protein ABW110_15960 [Steroidobacteraceae bacterium]